MGEDFSQAQLVAPPPTAPPPPAAFFPDMPPPSYAAAVGDQAINIADGDEKVSGFSFLFRDLPYPLIMWTLVFQKTLEHDIRNRVYFLKKI